HGTVDRAWLPNPLNSLWEYHLRAWHFHNGLDSEHTYEAHPAGWILQLRPTSFYWEGQVTDGCTADRCVQAITSVGNPVVWWVGLAALAVVLWMAVVRRDWRAWVALAGYAATYLPWFAYAHRTIFTFYAIALAPYVALTIVLAVAWVGGLLPPRPRPAPPPRRAPAPSAAARPRPRRGRGRAPAPPPPPPRAPAGWGRRPRCRRRGCPRPRRRRCAHSARCRRRRPGARLECRRPGRTLRARTDGPARRDPRPRTGSSGRRTPRPRTAGSPGRDRPRRAAGRHRRRTG